MSELPAAALFREHALRELREATRLSAGARHGHGAAGQGRRLAGAGRTEKKIPLLRQWRARCLKWAAAVRSPRAVLRGVPPQSDDSGPVAAAESDSLAQDR